jgi:tetratricopeptide (TPR) repeat protein
MRVAPRAAWEPFFTRPAFYQAPLYSYLLALLMRLQADAALWARIIQLALGVGATGLAYGVTRRLFGRGAALAGGMLMAVYGPLLVIESQILRDTLVLFLMLLTLFLYQSWTLKISIHKRSVGWLPLGIGVLLGVLAMAHEGAALLGVALLAAGMLRRRGRGGSWRWAALLLAGGLAGYAPLLARNLAVGAPVLPRFAGSAFAWAVANHATAGWGGATWNTPTPDFGATLAQSHGDVATLMAGVLLSYHGAWWGWLGHWTMRLGALGLGTENNENVCQAYFNRHVPILAFSVDFRVLLPLALAGAVLWGRRRWTVAAARGSAAAALVAHGVLVAAMLSMVLPLGRYRLMLLPALVPLAGRGLFVAWTALHARQTLRLAAALGVVAVVALAQWGLGWVLPFNALYHGLRPVDYQLAAKMYVEWGRPDLAFKEFNNGVDAGLPREAFDLDLAIAAETAGFETIAVEHYERALAHRSDDPIALLRLAWLRAAGFDGRVRDLAKAQELAQRCAAPPRDGTAEIKDLLAAVRAAAGDYAQARTLAGQALELARNRKDEAMARRITQRLECFRQGKPFIRPVKKVVERQP